MKLMDNINELIARKKSLMDHSKDLELAINFADSMITAGIAVQYLIDQKNDAVEHLKVVKEEIANLTEIIENQ
ncbi:MAG: hypothetical protein ACRDD8_15825 [Bacteroidales bacterium]